MRVAILDDYQNVFRTLKCYSRLKGHEVAVYHDSVKEPGKLAERLKGAEAVILLQQRTPFPRAAARVPATGNWLQCSGMSRFSVLCSAGQ